MYIDTFALSEYYLVPDYCREWVASQDPSHEHSNFTEDGSLFAEKNWLRHINEDPFFKLRKIFKRKGKPTLDGGDAIFFNGAIPKIEDLTLDNIILHHETGRVSVIAKRDGSDLAVWLSFSDFPLEIQENILNFIASL